MILDAVVQILVVAGGIFAVLGLWILLQLYLRRQSGCRNPNKDILDYVLNGCGGGGCQGKGSCHKDLREAHK